MEEFYKPTKAPNKEELRTFLANVEPLMLRALKKASQSHAFDGIPLFNVVGLMCCSCILHYFHSGRSHRNDDAVDFCDGENCSDVGQLVTVVSKSMPVVHLTLFNISLCIARRVKLTWTTCHLLDSVQYRGWIKSANRSNCLISHDWLA